MSGEVRIGISGWTYAPWFYPKGLRQKRELSYAANLFPTIEINCTFYSLQRPETFARWAAETPEGFVFAVKGYRYVTHLPRLKKVKTPARPMAASSAATFSRLMSARLSKSSSSSRRAICASARTPRPASP